MITASVSNDGSVTATGYGCEQGKHYVEKELFCAERTLTTTVRVINGERPLVSVRTNKPIPKELLFKARNIISKKTLKAPVKSGQVIEKNILRTNADVIATANVPKIKSYNKQLNNLRTRERP